MVSVTGFPPYELMFGCKAPAPCDAWLGLSKYDDLKSTNKSAWVDQHVEQIMAANKHALKNIKASAKKSADCVGGKPLMIPVGNLVLLWDHPEGHNKIQDNCKSELFVVFDHHQDPNVYYITPINGKALVRKVNRQQFYDLKRTQLEQDSDEENESDEQVSMPPKFIPGCIKSDKTPQVHPYGTRSKDKVPAFASNVCDSGTDEQVSVQLITRF